MLVRPAIQRDAVTIAKIHIASWQVAYLQIIPKDVLRKLNVDQRAKQWVSNIKDHACQTVVAESDRDDIVGFASFSATRDEEEDPKKVAEIQALYVTPNAWSKGIGQSLCAYAPRTFHSNLPTSHALGPEKKSTCLSVLRACRFQLGWQNKD